MADLPRADAVFIHGFWSSGRTWDRLLAVLRADPELAPVRMTTFQYESPKLPRMPWAAWRIPDFDDIAQSLPPFLRSLGDAETPLAFVTHSQGGLVLQRYLAWMLDSGKGRDLARVRTIVMLSCPNEGSEYFAALRAATGFNRHPQAADLRTLSQDVTTARAKVVNQIATATTLDDRHCPIPLHVYSGRSDNIVPRASAQSVFRDAEVLPGDHFTILDPEAPGNLTAPTLKRHLVDAFTARPAATPPQSAPEWEQPQQPPAASKYQISVDRSSGIQIGDHNQQSNRWDEDTGE